MVSFQKFINNTNDLIMPGQQPFDEMTLGAKLWVIKQAGDQVAIDEYVYIADFMNRAESGPAKTFLRKLPIVKVVIDDEVVRIRYSERSRAPDGSIMVNTASLALRKDGNDGLAGEYERTIDFQGSSMGGPPMVSRGAVTLVRNLEDNRSRSSDLDF